MLQPDSIKAPSAIVATLRVRFMSGFSNGMKQ
jgi:hypothetical protein